jgi:hypothetical protein
MTRESGQQVSGKQRGYSQEGNSRYSLLSTFAGITGVLGSARRLVFLKTHKNISENVSLSPSSGEGTDAYSVGFIR